MGTVVSALVIAFELGLYRAVNQNLQSGQSISNFLWYGSSILECLFPAVGVAFLASTRLLPDYRPLATPWDLAFFPLILLSVLRLTPRLCWACGIISSLAYVAAAYLVGWHFSPGPDGFTVTQTAVLYFAFVILITGALAAGVAAEIRTHARPPFAKPTPSTSSNWLHMNCRLPARFSNRSCQKFDLKLPDMR